MSNTTNNNNNISEEENEEENEDFKSSKLGTQQYWENCYIQELENFDSFGDLGEVWFGKGLVNKIINWFLSSVNNIDRNSLILDVGCGNAYTLISLVFNNHSIHYPIIYYELIYYFLIF
eukprot:TRINITY_DN2180_c0_g2_i1.p1 TRINITY_DN2180_c0_g2~~TRINITY_DN2180_c0_g2_i1.p1  ORF type:complete len:119 (+),score=35.77 TRINITY_DN2180_c0_g2_i1:137-493(+)